MGNQQARAVTCGARDVKDVYFRKGSKGSHRRGRKGRFEEVTIKEVAKLTAKYIGPHRELGQKYIGSDGKAYFDGAREGYLGENLKPLDAKYIGVHYSLESAEEFMSYLRKKTSSPIGGDGSSKSISDEMMWSSLSLSVLPSNLYGTSYGFLHFLDLEKCDVAFYEHDMNIFPTWELYAKLAELICTEEKELSQPMPKFKTENCGQVGPGSGLYLSDWKPAGQKLRYFPGLEDLLWREEVKTWITTHRFFKAMTVRQMQDKSEQNGKLVDTPEAQKLLDKERPKTPTTDIRGLRCGNSDKGTRPAFWYNPKPGSFAKVLPQLHKQLADKADGTKIFTRHERGVINEVIANCPASAYIDSQQMDSLQEGGVDINPKYSESLFFDKDQGSGAFVVKQAIPRERSV